MVDLGTHSPDDLGERLAAFCELHILDPACAHAEGSGPGRSEADRHPPRSLSLGPLVDSGLLSGCAAWDGSDPDPIVRRAILQSEAARQIRSAGSRAIPLVLRRAVSRLRSSEVGAGGPIRRRAE